MLPEDLVEISGKIAHPDVTQAGITITPDGRWALLVQVRQGTSTPLETVEQMAGDYPVVYEEEPAIMQAARPAFPDRGE